MNRISTIDDYQKEYKRSIENPEQFWEEQALNFVWEKKWNKT